MASVCLRRLCLSPPQMTGVSGHHTDIARGAVAVEFASERVDASR